MQRLEKVRQIVDDICRQQTDAEESRSGFVHLYGVSDTATLLALRRGLDMELAATAGMLHDIWNYKVNDPTDHARLSAIEAWRILEDVGDFSPMEIEQVCHAIAVHSLKEQVDEPFDELLKDADRLQHYLYNPADMLQAPSDPRIRRALDELNCTPEPHD